MTEREAYIRKLHGKIDEWDKDIDRVEAKAEQTAAEVRLQFQKQLRALREKRQEVENKAEEVRAAGENAWKDLQAGVQMAWDAMEEAVKSARERFS